ncbi:hypothetical protein NE571_12260 [Bacteroides sp. SL.2.06]|jgi:hypothetical protein|uniref:hypothetical protein n=1 Tax=Bacteroides sp. SL.2.06 TaxID=2965272 RepID=UPI00210F009B|nr:hypothetical protein [Bacteroides sp. SL.2.06]MCQ4810799.1 hypothetical protein [Bacteroides sp. SL.2.06]MCS3083695.1 hypothetical protein [Bacteroides ovatus]
MFDLLKMYENGAFYFKPGEDLKTKCMDSQIPKECCGVYIVYGFYGNEKKVMYIGSSGHLDENNKPKPRKGGLKRRIYGKQKNESGKLVYRNKLWPDLMGTSITKLEICWYNTGDDNPLNVEFLLLLEYIILYRKFPIWNKEIKLDKRLNVDLENFMKEKNISFFKMISAQ